MVLAIGHRPIIPPFPFNNNRMLERLVFYAPLWHERTHLNGAMKSPFLTQDRNHHSATVTGTTLTRLASGVDVPTFDGSDDWIAAQGNMTGVTQITIAVWLNLAAFAEAGTALYDPVFAQSFLSRGLIRIQAAGQRSVCMGGDDFNTGAKRAIWSTTGDATWHFVVGTFDTRCHIYVDGVLIDDADDTDTFTGDSGGFDIMGNGDANRQVAGILGEGWVYTRVLTLAEITYTHQSTKWRYL